MDRPINTGIMAYGMSGRLFHAPFISSHPGFFLRAVVERREKKAARDYPSIMSYTSVDQLLADKEIELVIVNTPNNTHFEYARLALLAGKHVLVEKPFSATADEAKVLFDIAAGAGLKIMPFQNRRWDSDFLSVREVIESGCLGKLLEVHFRFDRYRNTISPKAFKELPVPASGISYDLGSHLLDQAISLFGKPLKAEKTLGIYRRDSQVDDYLHFHLSYPDQLNVYLTASLLTAEPLPSFVLNGISGSFIKRRTDVQEEQLNASVSPLDASYGIELPGSEGSLTRFDQEGNLHQEDRLSLKGNYISLFEAVYQHIRNGNPYPIKEQEILCALELLQQAPVISSSGGIE